MWRLWIPFAELFERATRDVPTEMEAEFHAKTRLESDFVEPTLEQVRGLGPTYPPMDF